MTALLLGGGAMTYLTQLTVTSSYAADIVPALVAIGLGFGMIFAPAVDTAVAGWPQGRRRLGTGRHHATGPRFDRDHHPGTVALTATAAT